MGRAARKRTDIPSLRVEPAEPADLAVVTAEKADLQQRMDEARASISETAARITGTVEGKIDAVKSTVDGVLSIPEQLTREPVAWSLGALSVGFALGYGLGRAHHAKTPRGRPSRLANFADEFAAELATFCGTLVPPSLAGDIKSTLGVDVAAALENLARTQTSPRRSPRKKAPRAKRRATPTRKRTASGHAAKSKRSA